MMLANSFQVNPGEIEEIISHHAAIEDVCVAAVWDDSQATELPRAYVVARHGTVQHDIEKIAHEIREMVDLKVSGYKKLRGGVLFLEQLPRNATGKILRRLLPSEKKDVMAQGELKARL
jgi:4-coumarate--CoA ligase